jgi:PAB1-binding protein PBP1
MGPTVRVLFSFPDIFAETLILESFRTDTDITNSITPAATRERELQQWQTEAASSDPANNISSLQGDEATFGPSGGYSGAPWDQFEVNEQLFGVTTKFDEDVYTTKLDRSAPGFKERERKAQQIANEIMSVSDCAALVTSSLIEHRSIRVPPVIHISQKNVL